MIILVRWKILLPRVALSIGIAFLFWWLGRNINIEELKNIASILISLAGLMLGFLITSIALITSVMDKKIVSNMKKTGHFKRLIDDTFLTCILFLAVILFSIVSLFIYGSIFCCVFTVVISFSTLSLLYLIEAGRRFATIISLL